MAVEEILIMSVKSKHDWLLSVFSYFWVLFFYCRKGRHHDIWYTLNVCTRHFASLPFIKCNTELFSFLLLSILRVHWNVYFPFIQNIQLHLFLYEVMVILCFELSQHISVFRLNMQYCQMNFNSVKIEKYTSISLSIHFFAFAINSFNNNLSSNCYVNNVVIDKKKRKNKERERD